MAKSAGDRKRRKSTTHIVPAHLITVAPKPSVKAETKTAPKSSATLEAEAAKLRAELDKLKSAREALAQKSAQHSLKKKAPPPPPPSVVFSKKRRR